MKKILLPLIMLTIFSASAFAEITTFGEFDFGWSSDFTNPDDVSNDRDGFSPAVLDTAEIGFTGTVDEYTSVSFTFDFTEYGAEDYLAIPSIEISSDMTGVLGIQGPFSVQFVGGYTDFGSEAYDSATRYGLDGIADRGMDTNLFVGAKIGLYDMATVSFGMNPEIQTGDDGENKSGYAPQIFAGVAGSFDMFSAETYYLMNSSFDPAELDETPDAVGFGILAEIPATRATINVSASYNADIYDDNAFHSYGFGAGFAHEAFDIGFSSTGTAYDKENTFKMGFDAGYAINSIVTVYGGANMTVTDDAIYFTEKAADDDNEEANAGMELGVQAVLGATTYTAGYQMGAGAIENLTGVEGVFIRMAMSF